MFFKQLLAKQYSMVFIPTQTKDAKSNSFSSRTYSADYAMQLYKIAQNNLLHVNCWNKLAGGSCAKFQLMDEHGTALYRAARVNDLIRIQFPTPKKHYEWVRIEAIEDVFDTPTYQQTSIKVRSTVAPDSDGTNQGESVEDVTSTFIVERKYDRISACVLGRNDMPYLDTCSIWQKIRNAMIALLVMLGINTPQWRALAKGIVTKNRTGHAVLY